MLNLIEQKEIYKMLMLHLGLEKSNIPMPTLELDHTEDPELQAAIERMDAGGALLPVYPWFDKLGWFSAATADKVYLRPEAIQRVARQHSRSPLQLATLVYAHELGHSFHFAKSPHGYVHYPGVPADRTTYVESFAQLCTHAVARNLDAFGSAEQALFEELCDRQPEPYNYFRRPANELHLMAREVIVKYFLEVTETPLSELPALQQAHLRASVRQRDDYKAENELLDMVLDLNTMGFDNLKTFSTQQQFQNMTIR